MSVRRILKVSLALTLCLWLALILSGSAYAQGPGYGYCADEGQRCNFSGTQDVAYGANGQFFYRYGVSGGINCNNNTFGDPIPGVHKSCFIKDSFTLDLNPGGTSDSSAQMTEQARQLAAQRLQRLNAYLSSDDFARLTDSVSKAWDVSVCTFDTLAAGSMYGETGVWMPPDGMEDACAGEMGTIMDILSDIAPPVQ